MTFHAARPVRSFPRDAYNSQRVQLYYWTTTLGRTIRFSGVVGGVSLKKMSPVLAVILPLIEVKKSTHPDLKTQLNHNCYGVKLGQKLILLLVKKDIAAGPVYKGLTEPVGPMMDIRS